MKSVIKHKRFLCISAACHMGTEELIMRTYLFLEKIKMDDENLLQQQQQLEQQQKLQLEQLQQ